MTTVPYATPADVKMYAKVVTSSVLSDDQIINYTLNEDRFTIDTALVNGYGVDVPLATPPDAVKVLSAKCAALAILKSMYGQNSPSNVDFKYLKSEVEQVLAQIQTGELIL